MMEAVHVNPEYYSRIFKIFQEKDTETEINKEWLKENIMGFVDQCVRENEAPGPLKVLSLGCGTGDKDGFILDQLTKKYKAIDYTALDPNNEQMSYFKTNITESGKFKNVSFHLLEETAGEYMKREHPSQSFNFIHMIHMLYYVDNVQETIAHYFQCLSPGGIMLIFHANKGHHCVLEKFKGHLVKVDGFAYKFSDTIAWALEALELPYKKYLLISRCDIRDKDGIILDQLTKKYKAIDYTALDPNNEQMSYFKTNITESGKFKNVSFHLLEETADEYMKREHPSQSFNFIHMIHMLYYVDNVQETIAHYFKCLSPGGIMLIFHANKASGHHCVLEKFKGHLVKVDGFAYKFSDTIARALEALELLSQNYLLISRCDITEVFTDTEEGQMLLDFLTGVINFRNTAPPELVTKFCDELTKISFKKDGRLFVNSTSDAFSIKKPFE